MRKAAESPSTGVPMSTIVPRSCPPRLASAAARILFLAVILTLMTPLSFSSAASAAKRRSDADILPPLTSPLDFTLTAHGSGEGPTVLIVGGIQGDEPGGFSAAALLATHYRYDGGTVLVIPNLNFPSIIKRSRGLHGDMNRKFAALRENDPEYATVRRLQSIITRPEIDLVLNLHDGSGFYRPAWESPTHNPGRWGQSVIIDQEELPGAAFGRLGGNGGSQRPSARRRACPACAQHPYGRRRHGNGEKPDMVRPESRQGRLWPGSKQGFRRKGAGVLSALHGGGISAHRGREIRAGLSPDCRRRSRRPGPRCLRGLYGQPAGSAAFRRPAQSCGQHSPARGRRKNSQRQHAHRGGKRRARQTDHSLRKQYGHQLPAGMAGKRQIHRRRHRAGGRGGTARALRR